MRILDIVLESSAAEEAKRLGLVRKKGFGLYGPPGENEPATHMSRGGKLIPKQSSASIPAAATPDAPVAPPSSPAPETPSAPARKSRGRTPAPLKLDEVGRAVRATFGPDGKVDDIGKTLSAVTSAYGREKAPPIHVFGPDFDAAWGKRYVNISARAVYCRNPDIIGIDKDMLIFRDKPVDEWTVEETQAFATHIHESIHSARHTALSYGLVRGSRLAVALDEGITQFLTEGIVSETLDNDAQEEEYFNSKHTYPNEVAAIRLMIEYGDFDVQLAMTDNTSEEVREWSSRHRNYVTETRYATIERAKEAQDKVIETLMRKNGFSDGWIKDVQAAARRKADLGESSRLAIANPSAMVELQALVNPRERTTPPNYGEWARGIIYALANG
jgi:hypothetical protein